MSVLARDLFLVAWVSRRGFRGGGGGGGGGRGVVGGPLDCGGMASYLVGCVIRGVRVLPSLKNSFMPLGLLKGEKGSL